MAAESSLCEIFYGSRNKKDSEYRELVFAERHRQRGKHAKMRISNYRSIEISDSLDKNPSPVGFVQDKWVIPKVKRNLLRVAKHTHTLEPNTYINRHLSKELMDAIIKDPTIDIDVFSGSLEAANSFLRHGGFNRVEVIPINWVTDYVIILAQNTRTNKVKLVVNTPLGEAFPQEAVAHFLYYEVQKANGKAKLAINPNRIRVFKENRNLQDVFVNILKQEKLDPDIVMFGYKSNFEKMAEDMGFSYTGKCKGFDLCYSYMDFGGKKVLSVNIEPQLYGDRAGILAKAIQSLSNRKRAFIFVGTAGALSKDIPFGSYVVPSWHRHANQDPRLRINYENLAKDVLEETTYRDARLFKDNVGQVAIDSILYEDMGWVESNSKEHNSLRGASIVEQEGFGVISAAQAKGDHMFMVYRISDVPLRGEDFASTHLRLNRDDDLNRTQINLLHGAFHALNNP